MKEPLNRTWIVLRSVVILSVMGPAVADCDVAPPALTDFDFTPVAGDVSTAELDITCTMVVDDPLSGTVDPTCTFTSIFGRTQSCTAGSPSSGSAQSGTFACVVTIPQYSDSGIWSASVDLSDRVGNQQIVTKADLQVAGHPHELTLTSVPDTQGPHWTALVLTPNAINVDASDQTVTCEMTLMDSPAGVAQATCSITPSLPPHVQSCTATTPSSGTRNSGVFSCDITVPRYSGGGMWRGQFIFVDTVGAVNAPSTGAVVVTSTQEDDIGPALVDFSFSPLAGDTGSSPLLVTCDMEVTDALAGTEFAVCGFTGPGGQQEHACIAGTPVSGTPQNGTYRCSLMLPTYAEGGSWNASVALIDRTTNVTALDSTALAASGFPGVLTVDCGAPATPQPVLHWNDGETLAWNAISGALRYNVYRGWTSLLPVDYGACQNSRDPLLTDTTFTEVEAPVPGTTYQFLVSVTDPSGEGSLGMATGGAVRTLSSPCP